MSLKLNGVECTIRESLGAAMSSRRYHFENTDAKPGVLGRVFSLSCGLNVAYLRVRPFTFTSVLVLFFAGGNPLDPKFVVSEMHINDEAISHTHDHGDDMVAALRDWETRQVGASTATPPDEKTVKADG